MSPGDRRRPVCLLTGASGTLGHAIRTRARGRYSFAAVYNSIVPRMSSQETSFFDPLDPERRLLENDDPVFAIQADLTTQAGCEWAVQAALEQFGCIDVIVHSAARSVWGNVLESDAVLDSAAEQFAVNVLAGLRIAAFVGRWDWMTHTPAENRSANRNVVLVSSTAGIRLYEGSGQAVYGASKAALNHLAAHLAAEFDDIGVRVNAVAPESFPNPLPVNRVGDAVLALAASDASGKVLVLEPDRERWLSIPRYAGEEQDPGG
ncbi:MAG: oxidoreductase, family [Frankiales bacterium]|nr:oxidoreductase, family [Frankiales bacterium]